MNYRHAYHAGNFADVVKHVALAGILLHLKRKEKPFLFVDTHAGRGLYDLAGEASARTGEAAEGIAKIVGLTDGASKSAALFAYLDIVRGCGEGRYPGSPLIAARLLRGSDRLIAIERHPDDAEALRLALAPFGNAKAVCADGYAQLAALLPPPERRGVVLIDPPYEAGDEFARVTEALAAARKRFATGIFLAWYPLKSSGASEALSGEILTGGSGEVLRVTIDVGVRPGDTQSKERLSAASLLVVNPPYGLADEMRAAAAILAGPLGRSAPARIAVDILSRADASKTSQI